MKRNNHNSLNRYLKILKENKTTLSDTYGVDEIGIFGSHSRNKANTSSDVDICVKLRDEYLTFDNYMELKLYLQKLLGKEIDLAINDSIRREY